MSDSEEEAGGFLSGWSRRKLAARREALAPPPADDEPEEASAEVSPAEAEDAELIAALPSLDEITAGFDIKPFLAKGVPAKLKNAAMRKLWLASPSVRDYVDPAVDYAWDWNAPGGVPGGGGILSEQSVAKMVKDLIGGSKAKPAPTDDETAQDADMPEGADAASETAIVDQSPDVPPEPVRLTASVKTPDVDTAPQGVQQELPLPAPRRHGGAAPT